VEQRLATGAVPVTRGGKNLLRTRSNLAAAGLTEARWKTSPAPAVTLEELQAGTVVAVDVNAGHLDAAVITADGNDAGTRSRSRSNWPRCPQPPATDGSAPPSPASSPPRRQPGRGQS
jgi:hypothetical protein